MPCVLRFTAKHFDVDTHLRQSRLQIVDVFHSGDYQQTALASWVSEHPGFCATASNADFDNFRQQLFDATVFLQTNRQELLALSEVPGKKYFFLDFGLSTALFEEDVWVDAFHFPIEFLRLLGETGVSMEVSYYYPPSEGNASEPA